jgi:hypothetical protein
MYDENDAFNDPLKWWKENCAKYPYVASIDRKYLAIPATSAPSERVWSCLARILSLWHAHLSECVASGPRSTFNHDIRLQHLSLKVTAIPLPHSARLVRGWSLTSAPG